MAIDIPFYLDVDRKTRKPTTWDEIFAAAQRIKDHMDAFRPRFPGRADVIEKLMYALMTRHHLLLIGPHGAAKSMLVDQIFASIAGNPQVWTKQMTQSTKPSDVFGELDIRAWRETGKQQFNVGNTLTTAHLARLGEFFDANSGMSRSLLTGLHERWVRLGHQVFPMNLLTAVADTNFAPEEDPDNLRKMAAVVDRFLFRIDIGYVRDRAARVAMFQVGMNHDHLDPLPSLDFQDIVLVSGAVRGMKLIQNPYVLSAYEEATFGFVEDQGSRNLMPVSDRRVIWGGDVMEAHALLRGRTTVNFEDVDVARLALCGNNNEADKAYFDSQIPGIVEVWIDRGRNKNVEMERAMALKCLEGTQEPDLHQIEDDQELQKRITFLEKLLATLNDLDLKTAVVQRERLTHRDTLTRLIGETQVQLLNVMSQALPDPNLQGLDANALSERRKLTQEAFDTIRALKPVNDAVRTTQRELEDRCLRLKSEIETALVQ